MAAVGPHQQTTAILLLGASEFPNANLESDDSVLKENLREALRCAARMWREYFMSVKGYGSPPTHILDLFDKKLSPIDVDGEISAFLSSLIGVGRENGGLTDLIVCYVGHGLFDTRRLYCLALSITKYQNVGVSSLRLIDLAETLYGLSESLRIILILDACFSGTAASEMMSAMSAPETVLQKELEALPLPRSGVSLLCSSSHDQVSRMVPERKNTMFTEAVVHVLFRGNAHAPMMPITLNQLDKLAKEEILQRNGKKAVFCVSHSPRQSSGIVADVPIFPNYADPTVTPPVKVGLQVTGIVIDAAAARTVENAESHLPPTPTSNHFATTPPLDSAERRVLLEKEEKAASSHLGGDRLIQDWHLIQGWLHERVPRIRGTLENEEQTLKSLCQAEASLNNRVDDYTSSLRLTSAEPAKTDLERSVRALNLRLIDKRKEAAKQAHCIFELTVDYELTLAIHQSRIPREAVLEHGCNWDDSFASLLKKYVPCVIRDREAIYEMFSRIDDTSSLSLQFLSLASLAAIGLFLAQYAVWLYSALSGMGIGEGLIVNKLILNANAIFLFVVNVLCIGLVATWLIMNIRDEIVSRFPVGTLYTMDYRTKRNWLLVALSCGASSLFVIFQFPNFWFVVRWSNEYEPDWIWITAYWFATIPFAYLLFLLYVWAKEIAYTAKALFCYLRDRKSESYKAWKISRRYDTARSSQI